MRRTVLYSALIGSLSFMIVTPVSGTNPGAPGRPQLEARTPILERPWSVDTAKFRFVIVGDKWSGGEGKWPIFDRAMDEINLLHPDFAIMVGDLIPGHMVDREEWDRQWAEFFSHANRITVPFLFLPGNHDISNPEMYRWWQQDFGRTYYSFDYKGCHFLVIDTEEDRLDGRGPVWERMMQFIERDLETHRQVRHTFVLMHKPMWTDERYSEDWPRIERALAGRRYTVVAGHWHDLQFERRNGMVHLVVAGTGAGGSDTPIKELGAFNHYTHVTVDGDSVTMAVIEPGGPMWPVDIAPKSFREALENLVRVDSHLPSGLGGRQARIGADLVIANALPESVVVTVAQRSRVPTGWLKVAGDDSFTVALGPGDRRVREYSFAGSTDQLTPLPQFAVRLRYRGEELGTGRATYAPLFPDSVMRVIEEWMLIGPFDVGMIDTRQLPDNPRAGVPALFAGERVQFDDRTGTVREGDAELRWQKVRAQPTGYMNYNGYIGTKDRALAYAVCGIHSPMDQVVYAELRADNFAQILVNGELLEKGQVFDSPGTLLCTPVSLRRGWNMLAVKLVNNSGDWWLEFRLADVLNNLRFAAQPGEE